MADNSLAPDVLSTLSGEGPEGDPDDELVRRIHNRYRDASDQQQDWREKARTMYDMYAGEQWSVDDQMKLRDQDRVPMTFNRIAVVVDAIVGTEVNNRQETRYIPREQGDVQVNELLTGAADWVRDECYAEDEESDAFRDMIISGIGWTETRISYDDDPEGKIWDERVDPLEMYWDPGAKKKNLTDRRWQMRIKKVDWYEAMQTWPELAEIELAGRLASLPAPWDGFDDDTGSLREHVYPQDAYKAGREGAKDGEGGTQKDKVNIAHYQEVVFETIYLVESPQSQQGFETLPEAMFNKVRKIIEFRSLQYLKRRIKTHRQAFVFGATLLSESKSPVKSFTFNAMTGKRDRNKNHWFGVVQVMEDPQKWSNKFFSQILHIINVNAKGGIMMEEDAVGNIREFEENWAKPDGVAIVSPGALTDNKIMPKPPNQVPADITAMMQYSVSAIHDTAGASLEMLGMADRVQSGVLEYQRRQSGITILAIFFDAIRLYRKEQGRVMMMFIQDYISDGRLVRIIGQNGDQQYIPLIKQPGTGRYDVIVDEAPTSPNQKEKVFAVLQALLPGLLSAGVPIPPEVVDYTPLPSALAEKFKKGMQEGGKISPEVQQQFQKLVEENQQLKSKREEKGAELQIKRESNQADHLLAQEKLAAEMQLKWQELRAEIALDRAKITSEERARNQALVEAREASKGPKRKVKITRGEDGLMMSAEIEEVFEAP